MADKLTMDKSQALSIAQQIKKISVDNDNSIKALERANQTLRSGWQADAQRAYEECFLQMKTKLNTYTALLAEYSDTLTKLLMVPLLLIQNMPITFVQSSVVDKRKFVFGFCLAKAYVFLYISFAFQASKMIFDAWKIRLCLTGEPIGGGICGFKSI